MIYRTKVFQLFENLKVGLFDYLQFSGFRRIIHSHLYLVC